MGCEQSKRATVPAGQRVTQVTVPAGFMSFYALKSGEFSPFRYSDLESNHNSHLRSTLCRITLRYDLTCSVTMLKVRLQEDTTGVADGDSFQGRPVYLQEEEAQKQRLLDVEHAQPGGRANRGVAVRHQPRGVDTHPQGMDKHVYLYKLTKCKRQPSKHDSIFEGKGHPSNSDFEGKHVLVADIREAKAQAAAIKSQSGASSEERGGPSPPAKPDIDIGAMVAQSEKGLVKDYKRRGFPLRRPTGPCRFPFSQ